MKKTIIALAAPAALLPVSADAAEKHSPDVLFIAVDDLNDWIAPLKGHPQAITPNIDRLFSEGIYFTNAHSSCPVSTASRNSLLSGLHPASTGWYGSTDTYRKNYDEVMAGNMMLPEYFRNNGYDTYVAGKIFHNGDCDYPGREDDFWTERAPHFWDKMEAHIEDAGYGYRGYMFYPFPADGGQLVKAYGEDVIMEKYVKTNRFYSLCGGPLQKNQIPENGMYDEQIAAWAIDRIREDHDRPMFLAVGFLRPHVPYTAPERYFRMYDHDSVVMPYIPEDEMSDIPMMGKAIAFGFTPNGCWADINSVDGAHRELVHSYLACVTFVDEQIGKLLDALEESGKMDNTVIVLWSDHGQHLGEKHHFRKQALWEESTRVPLFFRVPGMSEAGSSSGTPVSLLDLYPTLVELCGLPENPKNQGRSLVEIIADPSVEREVPVVSSWSYGNFAVRDENWRYIRYIDGTEELYDHRTDPGEHINIASDPAMAGIKAYLGSFIPEEYALPAGTTEYKGGKYERLIEKWKVTGVPEWLM